MGDLEGEGTHKSYASSRHLAHPPISHEPFLGICAKPGSVDPPRRPNRQGRRRVERNLFPLPSPWRFGRLGVPFPPLRGIGGRRKRIYSELACGLSGGMGNWFV